MTRTVPIMAVAWLLAAPPAAAAAPQWGGSVTLSSNHLLHGVSRSSNDPSLAGEIHAQGQSGWFAALWAATSRVRPADDTTVDVAATLGFGRESASGWSWRASFAHYESPWQSSASWYRYDELTLDLQLRDVMLFSASWSPETAAYSPYFGLSTGREAFTYEISLQQALSRRWRVHAGAGYRDLSAHFGEGYWYGSVGLGWTGGRWQSDLSYVHPGAAASHHSWPGAARRRALLRLSYAF